jgi:hypothetical protein
MNHASKNYKESFKFVSGMTHFNLKTSFKFLAAPANKKNYSSLRINIVDRNMEKYYCCPTSLQPLGGCQKLEALIHQIRRGFRASLNLKFNRKWFCIFALSLKVKHFSLLA